MSFSSVQVTFKRFRLRTFGVIWIRISDPRSAWIMVHQKQPVNPLWSGIRRFLSCTMIQTDLESLILIQITPKERNIRFYLARDLHIILFDSHRRNADACSFKCITYHVSRLFSRSRLTRKSQFTRKENNHDTFRPKPMLSFADKILRSINGLRTS